MYTGSLGSVSNREDWIITSPLIDDTGAQVDLTSAALYFYVCREGCPDSPVLTATTANGKITLPATTSPYVWQLQFTPSDMEMLCAGTYSVFMKAVIASTTTQILSASVAIVDGGPS